MSDLKTAPEERPRAAPLVLWRALRALLCTIFSFEGEPQEIAARLFLSRRTHALLLPWVRAAEALLRRLLFIEALALADERAPAPLRRARKPRVRKPVQVRADRAEEWRVSFRLFADRRSARPARPARPTCAPPLGLPRAFRVERGESHARTPVSTAPERLGATVNRAAPPAPLALGYNPFRNPRPIAERLEAVLRVYNQPHPAARRLARLLQRDADRAARAVRPQPQTIANLVGPQTFARCDAILARRRRNWLRARALLDSS